jgi:prohibitin 2
MPLLIYIFRFCSAIINTMKINPFRKNSGKTKRITLEGEPLEDTGSGGGGFPGGGRGGFFGRGLGGTIGIVILGIVVVIIIAILVTGSVKIVEAGHRGYY